MLRCLSFLDGFKITTRAQRMLPRPTTCLVPYNWVTSTHVTTEPRCCEWLCLCESKANSETHKITVRCAYEILRRRDKNTPRSCPACNKLVSSRIHLCGSAPVESESTDGGSAVTVTLNANALSVDGLLGMNSDILLPSVAFCHVNKPAVDTESSTLLSPKGMYHSNLSLASLSMRASSLTIDSGQNATSSV
ncbi:hypothetical protein M5D96_010722 [Drosophila gunungcola]|uniref:Uncharacterized protein n=1 Tax=Drosophila gunungcola TaxID=103775 RepID=A0A9P9YGB6_9MUSC|nr:hypothetical protein M5D96_010722 [Drosophila gunungcola]